MTSFTNEQLELLHDSTNAVYRLLTSTRVVNKTKTRKRFALLMLHDMCARADSIRILCTSRQSAGTEQLARSCFEIYVDILNLYRYPDDYPSYLEYISDLGKRKVLQAIRSNPASPYSRSITAQMQVRWGTTVDELLSAINNELRRHRASLSPMFFKAKKSPTDPQAQVNTRIEDRARWADEMANYDAVYRLYSGSTHSELGSMLSSVARDGKMVWPPQQPPPSTFPVDLVTVWLLNSAKHVARKVQKPTSPFTALLRRRGDVIEDALTRSIPQS